MVTYIIESQGIYKIGRTNNMERRLKDYTTYNPTFELIHVMEFDCELFLQTKYNKKQFKQGWFYLIDEDIKWIRSNHEFLSNNTSDILIAKRNEEVRIEKEQSLLRKKEQKRINREQEILRRELEDKDTEAWLLKMLREHPERFSL